MSGEQNKGLIHESNRKVLEMMEDMHSKHGGKIPGLSEEDQDQFNQDLERQRADYEACHDDEIFDVEAVDQIGALLADERPKDLLETFAAIAKIIERTYRPSPLSTDPAEHAYWQRRGAR